MNRDTFSSYHPAVAMLYFVLVIGMTMFLNHPVCLGISLVGALAYSIYLKGKKAVRFNLAYMLPLLVITALINPAFSPSGGHHPRLSAQRQPADAGIHPIRDLCGFPADYGDRLVFLLQRGDDKR